MLICSSILSLKKKSSPYCKFFMKMQPITIFVHGTLPPEPLMRIAAIRAFFSVPRGLTKASLLEDGCHTNKIAKLLCASQAAEFDYEHFYLFGWSGKLSSQGRKEAAHELNIALHDLLHTYQGKHLDAHFRIITHSHGGNVALLVQESADSDSIASRKHLPIDELILLACPVQTETEASAKAESFRRIFSIHSHSDMFQVLDPQGAHAFIDALKRHGLEFTMNHLKELGPLFSSRHFHPANHIIQLNIRYPRRELLHIEFLLPDFINSLPALLRDMREQQNPPGKTEITHVLHPQ